MVSCIKIPESSVATIFLAIERATFQVVVECSSNFRIFKIYLARGARRISCQPAVNTFLAKDFFTLTALFS
jgi:hypothetical protein